MPQDVRRQAGRALDYWNEHTKAGYAKAADAMNLPRRWLAMRVFPVGLKDAVESALSAQVASIFACQRHGDEAAMVEEREQWAAQQQVYSVIAALLTEALDAMGEGKSSDNVQRGL